MLLRRELLWSAALVCLAALSRPAPAQDVLYVSDGGDNTVKRFDASTGEPLDGEQPFVGGLMGPRNLLVDEAGAESRLLVANQNVLLKIPGDVQAYDTETGERLADAVSSADKDAPYVAWGLLLGFEDDLFVTSLSTAEGQSAGELLRFDAETGEFLGALETREIKNKEFHPRGLVFGPDGLLYVSVRTFKKDGLGGGVIRFYPDGSSDVFVYDAGGPGRLNRPDGVAFGPDGNLYVNSFSAGPGDADAIRIYDPSGAFVGEILLFDPATEPRQIAQSLRFGPGGRLYVPISNTGEVRAYDVATGDFETIVPAGGPLLQPLYLTFGQTDPSTLDYVEAAELPETE